MTAKKEFRRPGHPGAGRDTRWACIPSLLISAVTSLTFDAEVLGSKRPFLVEFTAPWCGPCRLLAPVVVAVARELDGRISAGLVDAEESPDLCARYRVTGLPTVILFQDGQEIARRRGTMTHAALRDLVMNARSTPPAHPG
jgi:thioredoxin 1